MSVHHSVVSQHPQIQQLTLQTFLSILIVYTLKNCTIVERDLARSQNPNRVTRKRKGGHLGREASTVTDT